ncbi:interferon a3-like isoform X2 [Alosa sapidissima]|uniref:interferon a3-like isoform X2 n=1 Tax=Alosa sapidissima TaxID=34773 RepID=UPI001C08838A|nr:interferon a3-like isoform X2 [Alosa sapidissima]
MQHKFPQYSRTCLTLLKEMGEKIVEDNVGVHFPDALYRVARKQQPERIIWFIAQVLDEVSLLLDENVTTVAWDQKKLKDFMSTLDTQLVATQSCVVPKTKGNERLQVVSKTKGNERLQVVSKTKGNERLHLYFENLRNETLGTMEDKAKAWELIRKEVHHHLTKVDLLASTRL